MPVPPLPPLPDQAERLIDLGVHELAGRPAGDLHAAAAAGRPGSLLVIHPDLAPASMLAPLVHHRDKAGFVVVDMADVDYFRPVEPAAIPAAPIYLVDEVAAATSSRTGARTKRGRPSPRPGARRCCWPRACTGCCSSRTRWSAITAS